MTSVSHGTVDQLLLNWVCKLFIFPTAALIFLELTKTFSSIFAVPSSNICTEMEMQKPYLAFKTSFKYFQPAIYTYNKTLKPMQENVLISHNMKQDLFYFQINSSFNIFWVDLSRQSTKYRLLNNPVIKYNFFKTNKYNSVLLFYSYF